MEIGAFILAVCNSRKVVDMKLTLETLVFCLLTKIALHHSSSKYFGLVDSECLSMGQPRDDAFLTDRCHLFKHVVKLDGKRELCQREKTLAIE